MKGKPISIAADCIKGKGLSYLVHGNAWHKGVPADEQFRLAGIEPRREVK